MTSTHNETLSSVFTFIHWTGPTLLIYVPQVDVSSAHGEADKRVFGKRSAGSLGIEIQPELVFR